MQGFQYYNNYIYFTWGDIIKSLFKAVATLTIFSIITKFLGFAFRLYLSRILPTSVLGMYTIAASVCLVLETIVGAGIPLVISRYTATNIVQNNKNKSYSVVSAGLIWCLSLSTIIITIVLFCNNIFNRIFTDKDTYIILLSMLPTIFFTALYTPFKGYLWGEERYFAVSFIELMEQMIRISSCIILFTFFKNISIILPAGLGLSIACALSCIIGIIIFFCVGGKLSNPHGYIKQVFITTAPLTATRVAGSFMTPLINIILPFSLIAIGYSNSQAMSEIGIALGMTLPLLFVPSAVTMSLGMAITPKLATLKQTNKNFALCNQINSSITFTLYSSILFVPLFFGLGNEVCSFLYGNMQAGIYLEKFAWLIIPMGLSQISTSILNSLGEEKSSFKYFLISSCVIIALIATLPKIAGISALFIALGMGNMLTFTLNILKINKITGKKGTYMRKCTIMTIISLVVGYFINLVYNVLIFVFPNVVTLLLCFPISVVTLFVMLMCFGLIDFELINNITKKLKSKSIKAK